MKPLRQAVYSSRSADKFVVRLPDGMREKIAVRAKGHHRSMNSEIISVLERDLDMPATDAGSSFQRHTNDDVTTPVTVGMLAYYRFESAPEQYMLGAITGLAVSLDDNVSVTFDIMAKMPSYIVGSIANDPRRWFSIDNIKPFLI